MKVSPGCEQRQEHRLVHLAARMGLDVGEAGAEQLLGALDRQRLDHVDIFAAAVIAPARIAFGIFVGEDRALRLEHGAGDDVLATRSARSCRAGGRARGRSRRRPRDRRRRALSVKKPSGWTSRSMAGGCSCGLLGEMRGGDSFSTRRGVAAAAERRGEEGLDAGLGHLDADQPRAHGDDVGVVMLAGEAGRERLGDQRAAAGRDGG